MMVITLSNRHLSVSLKPLGGELSSIKDASGVEYLWQGDPTYWSGQAPLLFPICGSLRDNQTCYPDNALAQSSGSMPRHGLVRKEMFDEKQVSHHEAVYTLVSTGKMYEQFPYQFQLKSRYVLAGQSIRISYEITNLEKDFQMPFTLGAHPAFNCPIFSDERYEDYHLAFEVSETVTVPRVYPDRGLVDLSERTAFLTNADKLELDYDLFKDDTLVLDQLQSRTVTFCSRKHQRGLKLHLDDFPFLVLWSTANKGPFIAMEPWLGMSDDPNGSAFFVDKINTQYLAPGEKKTYAYRIEIF